MSSSATVQANPTLIQMWATRTKCAMCKHHEAVGHVLPSGRFDPAAVWAFHYQDTHGFPRDAFRQYIWNSVYGLDTSEAAIFGLNSQTEGKGD